MEVRLLPNPPTASVMRTIVIHLFLWTMSSATEGTSTNCQENVCEAIVFNQLALAELKHTLAAHNDSSEVTRGLSKFLIKNKDLHIQVTNIAKMVASWGQSNEDMSREVDELRRNKTSLETAMQLMEYQNTALQQKNLLLEQLRSEIETKGIILEQQATTLKENYTLLEQQESQLQRNNILLKQRLSELGETNTLLVQQMSVMEKEKSAVEEEKSELEEDSRELENCKSTMEEDKRNTERERFTMRAELKELKKDKQHLEEEIKDLQLKTPKPKDCADIQLAENTQSGIYEIYPLKQTESVKVMCDLTTDGGGWTIFLNRQITKDDPLDFNESWEKFRDGFGNVDAEYWLGNEILHKLTLKSSTLRIDASNFREERRWAAYDEFQVAANKDKYKLHVDSYRNESTMGDSLTYQDGYAFSTFDSDNDGAFDDHCAVGSTSLNWGKGGWWYASCGSVRPTAPLLDTNDWDSAVWEHWEKEGKSLTSLKSLSMKFRRDDYEQPFCGCSN